MRTIFFALGLILASLRVVAAFEIEEETRFSGGEDAPVLSIISTTDTAIFAPLILGFMQDNPGITVDYVVTGSQDLYTALADEKQSFDLAISSAMDLQMKLANDGNALPHTSAQTQALPSWAYWRELLFAFAQEPVVLALDNLEGLTAPRTREDLIKLIRENPEYFAGRIGTYDPSRSGAGYLFATQDARQSDTYWRLFEVIGRIDPVLYTSTSAMIDDLQSGKLVLAYNLLGPYVAARLPGWDTGSIVEFRDFTHVLLRTALIPRTANEPELGRLFLDYLLSDQGRQIIETQTGLPPINEEELAAQPHLRPIRLDPGLLVFVDPLKRRKFLNEWNAAIIQQ